MVVMVEIRKCFEIYYCDSVSPSSASSSSGSVPGLPSPSPDISCSNSPEACPSDSRGFASFPRDHVACCCIPVFDIPLLRGPKCCNNNDNTSNSVCFSPRPVRFPYHSIGRATRCLHRTFRANHADCYRLSNFSIRFFEMDYVRLLVRCLR
jgi:hypothetical protein